MDCSNNEKHCTAFPRSNQHGIFSRQTQLPKRTFTPPPPLPLKINGSNTEQSAKCRVSQFHQSGTPWKLYQRLCKQDEAGTAIIAFHRKDVSTFVAIKERPINDMSRTDNLVAVRNSNVAHLLSAFIENKSVFFVYETIPVSLMQVGCCPHGPLKEPELSNICKQISLGLKYIWVELNCSVTNIRMEDMLVSDLGYIKIANVGDRLLETGDRGDQYNAKALFDVLVTLMEPGSTLRGVTELQHPGNWSRQIQDFLHRTKIQHFDDLFTDAFLECAPDNTCLIPYVQVVRRCRWYDT